ncbi:hypothetical protein PFISCL1PPCAC_16814, partial [Pristionchus fissidentatus]
ADRWDTISLDNTPLIAGVEQSPGTLRRLWITATRRLGCIACIAPPPDTRRGTIRVDSDQTAAALVRLGSKNTSSDYYSDTSILSSSPHSPSTHLDHTFVSDDSGHHDGKETGAHLNQPYRCFLDEILQAKGSLRKVHKTLDQVTKEIISRR